MIRSHLRSTNGAAALLPAMILAVILPAMILAVMWTALAQPARAQADIPPLTGRVMDRADILSASTERTLTGLLTVHEDSTGNQIVVATVPSLQGEAIEAYALRAGRAWGIGTVEHDNGIVIIVAPDEREVRIEVGYGLEGAVPDAIAARIIRNEIIPEFREGDFDGGVSAGTVAILDAVAGEYEAEGGSDGPPPLPVRIVIGIVFGLIVAGSAFGALMARSKAGRWIGFAFLMPLAFASVGFLFLSLLMGLLGALVFAVLFIFLAGRPSVRDLRTRLAEAAAKDEPTPVSVGLFTLTVGGSSSSGLGGSSGGGFGGGGFSGGGGSFGGGGASGGW